MPIARPLLAAIVLLLALDFVVVQVTRTDRTRDTVIYWTSVERIHDGGTMYDPPPPHSGVLPSNEPLYLYPPYLGAALALLPRMSFETFARVWFVFLFVAAVGFAASLERVWRARITFYGTLAALATLAFVPRVLLTLNLGQVDVLVWAMVGAAIAFPVIAGAGFAIAALVKVYAVWTILAAVMRQDWRLVRQALIVGAVFTVVAALVLGPSRLVSETTVWISDVAPVVGQGQHEKGKLTGGLVRGIRLPSVVPSNLSIPAATIRPLLVGGSLPRAARTYLLIVGVAAPLIVAWFGRRWRREWHYVATLAAALLFAPLCRPSYVVALLPAVPLAIRDWRTRRTLVMRPVRLHFNDQVAVK